MSTEKKVISDKLPTPIEIIEKVLEELRTTDLREGEKEHLTEVASNLTDFLKTVKSRLSESAS